MIVGRGIAGFGAGGEYPVCATSSTESADETERLRKHSGFLVASTTDFAVDLVSSRQVGKGMPANARPGLRHRRDRRAHRARVFPSEGKRGCLASLLHPRSGGKCLGPFPSIAVI